MRMFPYSPINYSVAEPYDVRCTFDEEHHEWIYVISIPEKEMAAQWLKGENNRKNAQRLFYSGGKEKISKN